MTAAATIDKDQVFKITLPEQREGKLLHGKDRHSGLEFENNVAYTKDPEQVRYAQSQSGWKAEPVDGFPAPEEEEEAPKPKQEEEEPSKSEAPPADPVATPPPAPEEKDPDAPPVLDGKVDITKAPRPLSPIKPKGKSNKQKIKDSN